MINNSYRKPFSYSLYQFLMVRISSEKSNFALLKCLALCQFTKYSNFLEANSFFDKIKLILYPQAGNFMI